MINFSICLIGKNEEHTIPRLAESLYNFLRDGGEVIYLDTGSSDNSLLIAETQRFKCYSSPNTFTHIINKDQLDILKAKYITEEEYHLIDNNSEYFDFAAARNTAHKLATNDMILSIDCSDILLSFDYHYISHLINEFKVDYLHYNLICTSGDNSICILITRFYDRRLFKWELRTHEHIKSISPDVKSINLTSDILQVNHIKNMPKSRNYWLGMALDLEDNINKYRSIYYLAREFYYHELRYSAKKLIKIYCKNENNWRVELSCALAILGECYYKLHKLTKSIKCYRSSLKNNEYNYKSLRGIGEIYLTLYINEVDLKQKLDVYSKVMKYQHRLSCIELNSNIMYE